MARRNLCNPEGASNILTFSFKATDSVYAQLQVLAEEREWTMNHLLRKIVPLGLEVYLRNTTLPSPLEVSGNE